METKSPLPYYPGSINPSGLEPHQSDTHAPSVLPYLHIISTRKWLIVVCLIVSTAIAIFINQTQLPVYEGISELVYEMSSHTETDNPQASLQLMRDPTFMMTQKRLINSPRYATRLETRAQEEIDFSTLLDAFAIPYKKGQVSNIQAENGEAFLHLKNSLAAALNRRVSIREAASGARIVQLSMESYNPVISRDLTNMASEVYIQMNHEDHIQQFEKKFSMISNSLSEIREKIKTGELTVDKIGTEIELLEALKVFGERHPKVIELRDKINELIDNMEHGVIKVKQLEIGKREKLLSLISEPHLTMEQLIGVEKDLYNLKPLIEQEITTNREIYQSIYKRLQEIDVTGDANGWLDIKIIKPAGVPAAPSRPNKKMNLILGFLAGLLTGIGLAFLLEYLDSSIRNVDDIQNYLKIFPLGMVPEVEFDIEELKAVKQRIEKGQSSRILWNTSDLKVPLYVAEAYRIIRTNFVHRSIDQNKRIFQVTSAVKGEGKTTTTANLGISLAQTGLKVLLIDGDMRRPSLHRVLHLGEDVMGLRQLISNQCTLQESVRSTQTDNLCCIPSGGIPENPAELLSSRRFSDIIDQLKEQFDIILIDSPPVVSVADAPIISSRVEGTVLITRAGYIPRHLCLQAKRAIEAVNGQVLGCILNSVSSRHHSYYYAGYYKNSYYNYYGNEQKKTRKKHKKRVAGLSRMDRFKLTVFSLMPTQFKNRDKFLDTFDSPRHPSAETREPSGFVK